MKKVALFSFIFIAIYVGAISQGTTRLEGANSNVLEWNDSLIGKFNGIDIDTLACEPYGNVIDDEIFGSLCYDWRVFTLNGTIAEIHIANTVGIKFVNEGDLDGNGSDEWGFLVQLPTGAWTSYCVFTAIDGKWELLIDPITIWAEHVDKELNPEGAITLQDIVRPSHRNGYVEIKQSVVDDEIVEYFLVDSIVQISPKEYSSILIK